MTSLCWADWIKHFEAKGYKCLSPNWPGRDRGVDDLRRFHPDKDLGKLTLSDVVTHFEKTIKELDSKPVAVGHSMGGLVVQLLLQKDLIIGGIAIDSAAPAGLFVGSWPFLRSNWPHITPFVAADKPIEMTFKRFQYTFTNGMTYEDQKSAFDKYVVPESRQVPRESLRAKVDFKRRHSPLLMIAGSIDHLIPVKLNRKNYAKYKQDSLSDVDYKEFKERTHYIIGQKNWEQVADYALGWIKEKGL